MKSSARKGDLSKKNVKVAPPRATDAAMRGLTGRVIQSGAQDNSLSVAIDAGLERSRPEIDELAASLLVGGSTSPKANARVLLDIAAYYERIADASAGLTAAKAALSIANNQSDADLKRRANNVIGIAYSRNYDFLSSSAHLIESTSLAAEIGEPLLGAAALSNFVSLLITMGLYRDGELLCTSLFQNLSSSNCDKSGDTFLNIQLQNAINGAIVSRKIGDLDKAHNYVETGERLVSHARAPLVFRGLFAAAKAEVLAEGGRVLQAKKVIDHSIAELYSFENKWIRVALASAEASVASHGCAEEGFSSCIKRLSDLLEATTDFPQHNESLLRAFVTLYASRGDEKATVIGRSYLEQLTAHLILVKHRQFFNQLRDNYRLDKLLISDLGAPTYRAIDPLGRLNALRGSQFDKCADLLCDVFNEYIDQSLFVDSRRSEIEISFRSEAYRVAENWAIAAELRAGGDGRHGRLVGCLAKRIALKLGYEEAEATQLDLACRLHDIGKLAVIGDRSFEMSISHADEIFLLGQHSVAGSAILSQSKEKTLSLGASIALAHHEVWNGVANLAGANKSSLPLEARICAVADAWSDVYQGVAGDVEPSEIVGRQLRSMSGLQLDPEAVEAALNVISDDRDGKPSNRERLSLASSGAV